MTNFLNLFTDFRPTSAPTSTSSSTTQLSHKRKAETELEEPVNEAPRETDYLKPVFEAFLTALKPLEDGTFPLYEEVVEMLGLDDNVVYGLHQTPLRKIKHCFKQFMSEFNVFGITKIRISYTLKLLYPIALENSSTFAALPRIHEAIPKLKQKLKHDVPKEIHMLLRNSRELIRQANDCKSFREINEDLAQIDKILQQLSEFRGWKQFQDKEENQRIIDLARHCKKRKDDMYSTIIREYKPTVAKLEPLYSDLTAASQMAVRLHDLKIQLQKQKSMMMEVEQKENPLETRFLKAFGTPFYEAFAYHFWNLLWTSVVILHHSDIEIILKKIPDWNRAISEVVDHEIISQVWSEYFPDVEFQEWILTVLGNRDSTQLDKLENDLQSLTKNINQIHEDWGISKYKKSELEKPYQEQMEKLCINATKPSFFTLFELKNFLKEQKEK